MNTYHRFGIITLCLMASFAILGVSLAKATSLSQYAAPQAPTHKIGLAFPNLTSDRFVRDEKVMRQILEDKGYEVISQDANEDANVQNAQIDDMVAQGAKVIIVIAVDSQASATTVENAALAGVKVIAYDRLIKSSSIACHGRIIHPFYSEAAANPDSYRVKLLHHRRW
jgi:D-xylose transport system substrate-binding protein